jgi:hypothetical protein
MKLQKGERYNLTKPLTIRTALSIGKIPVGEEIEIQQVDQSNRKYLVDNTWIHYSVVENVIN